MKTSKNTSASATSKSLSCVLKINRIAPLFRFAMALAAIAFALGVGQAQAQYSWYSFSNQFDPPYNVPSNFWGQEVLQIGTVPVMVAPAFLLGDDDGLADGMVYTLLNHKDSNGDYEVYAWESNILAWTTVDGAYVSGITTDTYNAGEWGITQNGEVWSTYPNVANQVHYWNNITSLAVQNVTAPNPAGFLFATFSNSTTNGSANGGPSGNTIELFHPSGEWPNGTWTSTGWGAYQVSADPMTNVVAALDNTGVVWEIAPAYYQQPYPKKPIFLGYRAQQLSYVQCRNSDAITFAEVAVKDGIFLGLDSFAGGSPQISNAVWYYTAQNCWQQVGSRNNFLSISTDAGSQYLVWATDTNGKIWYAE
jgi:hypothetical protein